MSVNPSPTGTNGQYSPQAVASALASVPGLVQAQVTKGLVPQGLAADAAQILQQQLQPALQRQGVQQLAQLFSAMLPSALSGAARRAASRNASAASPSGAAAYDPSGLGPGAGWPAVPAGGPGGAGNAGPGSNQAPWPAARAGAGGDGLSADPALRPSFVGPAGGGSFFDPTLGPTGPRPYAQPAAAQGRALPTGSTGAPPPGSAAAAAALLSGGGGPSEVLPGELAAYFNPGPRPQGDDAFVVADWIGTGQNPFLMRAQLSRARELHYRVILPCARHYKRLLYGDPDYPVRLGQVLYGIIPAGQAQAAGAGPTARYSLGEAVNFAIAGVPPSRVCDDIEAGLIPAEVGAYADVNGVYATLPYSINGMEIRGMRLRASAQVPGGIGYSFGGGA